MAINKEIPMTFMDLKNVIVLLLPFSRGHYYMTCDFPQAPELGGLYARFSAVTSTWVEIFYGFAAGALCH